MIDKSIWKRTLSKDLKPGDIISFLHKRNFIGIVLDRHPFFCYKIYVLKSDNSVIELPLLKYELKL